MSSVGDPALDPASISARSFSTSFRGFDQAEVKAYLRGLSEAIARQDRAGDKNSDALRAAKRDLDSLTDQNAELEARIDQLGAALEAADEGEVELDEASITRYIGEETTRILEAANAAAAGIVAKAESDAQARTDEVDRVQAIANKDVSELLRQAHSDAADVQRSAEAEAAELTSSSQAEADAMRTTAGEEADANRQAAADEAAEVRLVAATEVEALRAEALAETQQARRKTEDAAAASKVKAEAERAELVSAAESLMADAETEAARIGAESEADALASQEGAKETARFMVVEAQQVREKVLADLVKRRRLGRQQLDQAKAARDRLQRAVDEVRRQIDDSAAELEAALPEAKSAIDAVARRSTESEDGQDVRDLEIELDGARGSGVLPEPPVVTSGSAALESLDGPEGEGEASTEQASTEQAGADQVSAEPAVAVVESDLADGAEDEEGGDEDAGEEEEEIHVPDCFLQRDIAMTRQGADLRRRIKRIMADDQSDVLDRLRRAKKMSTKHLPPVDAQRASYLDALAPSMVAAAEAGAAMTGGSAAEAEALALADRVTSLIHGPLRARIEQAVEAAGGDMDEVLEPVRAHYRDLRTSEVGAITDDALSEAFALGAYQALAEGTELRWLADPRFEPTADCFDNTLAISVVKPDPFPTGLAHPGGEPGCRCLVVEAES